MFSKLAFFGATGGSVGACLAAALEAGYTCTALARTPSKLETTLLEKGLSRSIIDTQLTIISGDVRDLESVQRTIAEADIILSGIGAYPTFQLSIRMPLILKDRTICADGTATILRACQQNCTRGSMPLLILISTAGVLEEGKPSALPLAYRPWYHWLLADPHADKVVMEESILQHMELPESERGIGGYVIVKPSILTDGSGRGLEAVRAGTADSPIGYTIDRKMVGEWMFQRLIQEGGATGAWKNTRVTITY